MTTTTTATTEEARWTPTLRRRPWSCLKTTQTLQETAMMGTLQEETMQKMVLMTQLHQMVVTMTQMMI
jgi:hypothetical protein